jgi:hypothetical protein
MVRCHCNTDKQLRNFEPLDTHTHTDMYTHIYIYIYIYIYIPNFPDHKPILFPEKVPKNHSAPQNCYISRLLNPPKCLAKHRVRLITCSVLWGIKYCVCVCVCVTEFTQLLAFARSTKSSHSIPNHSTRHSATNKQHLKMLLRPPSNRPHFCLKDQSANFSFSFISEHKSSFAKFHDVNTHTTSRFTLRPRWILCEY